MDYAESLEESRDALAKLGPAAVDILAKRLKGTSEQGDALRYSAAREILDRLGIGQTNAPT
jgi:hypothetical protein